MSNSIINYKNKYFNPNDSILILSLYQLRRFTNEENIPNWFHQYLTNVVDEIIESLPIGWCDLELDEYFESKYKNIFFIDLIKRCITNLNIKNINFINNDEINKLFKLEGIEKWDEKRYILISDIVECLKDLILLLDEEVTHENQRLKFYKL